MMSSGHHGIQSETLPSSSAVQRLIWKRVQWLAWFTIAYNLAEGAVSVWFGYNDEALALFGFGADSFIEVGSAVVIAHMVARLRRQGSDQRDNFERSALRATGILLQALAIVLVLTSVLAVVAHHQPESTTVGTVVSLVSMCTMWWLIREKVRCGKALASAPILADAACSRACLHMSCVLFLSSLAASLFGIGYLDAVGAAVLSWLAFKEGRESLDKARGLPCSDGCHG